MLRWPAHLYQPARLLTLGLGDSLSALGVIPSVKVDMTAGLRPHQRQAQASGAGPGSHGAAYKNFPLRLGEVVSDQPAGTPSEGWSQAEMRVGQKNGLVYQWARKATRPGQPADQRYENAYLFGAVCPARDIGAALAMPAADTEAMQKHLDEIARTVETGAHAIVLLDRAGWHTTDKLEIPKNLTLLPIPPVSPELNAAENIWQYLRQT